MITMVDSNYIIEHKTRDTEELRSAICQSAQELANDFDLEWFLRDSKWADKVRLHKIVKIVEEVKLR